MVIERLLWMSTTLLLITTNVGCVAKARKAFTLKDMLPEDQSFYDKMVPPEVNDEPTEVIFNITVMQLSSVDETSMTYSADLFLSQYWKDDRLRLPENMTAAYRILDADWLKHIWRPDAFFKNAEAVKFQTMTIPNHYLWIHKDGTILYTVKVTLILTCAMSFYVYPHDVQTCKIEMESISHTTADLVFKWDTHNPLDLHDSIELPQMELIYNGTGDCTQVYNTGNFSCLEVVFKMKRRLGYHLFNTYVPACLIVIISWISFWIKPDVAPARVTLGVTSLLTLSTQQAKTQAQLPPVSYLKAIDGFMSVCTVFVFMALMEYCLVNIILGDTAGDPKMAAKGRKLAVKIDRISRIVFPSLFFLVNLLYWLFYN